MAGQRRQTVGPVPPANRGPDDELDLFGRHRTRASDAAATCAIDEAGLALVPVPAQPLVGGGGPTPALRELAPPSILAARSVLPAAVAQHVELGHTMGHRVYFRAWC